MSDDFKFTYKTYDKYGFPMIRVKLLFKDKLICELETIKQYEGESNSAHAQRIAKDLKYKYLRDLEKESEVPTIHYNDFKNKKANTSPDIQISDVLLVEE